MDRAPPFCAQNRLVPQVTSVVLVSPRKARLVAAAMLWLTEPTRLPTTMLVRLGRTSLTMM